MSDVAIRVDGLGKKYTIGELVSFRDLPRLASAPLRALLGRGADRLPELEAGGSVAGRSLLREHVKRQEFWAVRDVSFEVKRGEVLGIIGHNGAGKSTLLKLLSRITAPTTGRIEMYGRASSLLEVGTGFNPELTGRENIYLNGSILGMGRREIDGQFDAIVEFAGVANFIDTPVKRYSSGMMVRLGFAVAAHLQPEILIVDEVLAVGDAAFQRRCLGKMQDVATSGRTVLFVSHSMAAVRGLCTSAMMMEGGRVRATGTPHDITDLYLSAAAEGGGTSRVRFEPNAGAASLVEAELQLPTRAGERPVLRVVFSVRRPVPGLDMTASLCDRENTLIWRADVLRLMDSGTLAPGEYAARIDLPSDVLVPSTYLMTLSLHVPYQELFDRRVNCLQLPVPDTEGSSWHTQQHDMGILRWDPGLIEIVPLRGEGRAQRGAEAPLLGEPA